MRRLLTWIVVTLGIAAIARRLRKRGQVDETTEPGTAQDDPADELRQKLAESRSDQAPVADNPGAEAPEPASPDASVEDRRADVHEQGRATLDEMRGPNDS
jgi:hypothetical protein